MAGYYADTPASQSPQKEKSGAKREAQLMLPVTILQLKNAKQVPGEDIFRIDGRLEAQYLCIVGQVLQKQEQITSLQLEVGDGTGSIDVKMWVDLNDATEYNNTKRAEWSEGAYVKVVGNLRSFNGVRQVVAFRIHRVEDQNEVTFHQAHAAFVHLFYEKGISAQQQAQAAPAPAAASSSASGNEALPNRIHELIKLRSGPNGLHVNDIRAAFAGSSIEDITASLKLLADNGWIFTGADEDHYTAGSGVNAGY